MVRTLGAVLAALLLTACGSGGGGSSSSSGSATTSPTPTPTPPALSNFATVTVDQGPAALSVGPDGFTQSNVAYVSVKICAPGSATNCQTVDHIQVDTGSIGLRVFRSVLTPALLNALPYETDVAANPVGECYQYIDGYVFGSVRLGDFSIGGESVAGMPFHVISDTGQFATVPSSCSSAGGSDLGTVTQFGSNGIIGIGTDTTDCGVYCQTGGQSAAIYYDCASTGCSSVIARAVSTTAPFQQLPNPVAAMGVDNNGTILSLPAVAAAGQAVATGTLYFGIGTQTNNGLGSAAIYTTDSSGLITVQYKGKTLPNSFIDSGSSVYFFVDDIPLCTQSGYDGLYCPPQTLALAPTIVGLNGVSFTDTLSLYNAYNQYQANPTFSALPGLGANPSVIFSQFDFSDSFDFGLPFFYGRPVYTAIQGRNAGGTLGPYYAF